MLILGEVHTGLLQSAGSLSPPLCEDVLGLFRGEAVRRFERPIAYAASPDLLTGVDCTLATASGTRLRGVGTVVHRATITGGRVLQGSAAVTVMKGAAGHRLPWSHYLALPGQVEVIGKAGWADLVRGFVAAEPAASGSRAPAAATLDLGAISGRVMDRVQASPRLDRSAPFRAARTRLRWVAATDGEIDTGDRVAFAVERGYLRTLLLHCSEAELVGVAALCEDLALHDWLLTTLLEVIERSQIGAGTRDRTVERLHPAVDHLLHLWMPAARLHDPELVELWECLEQRPGFSRQWQASVNRVRDQLAVSKGTRG